LLASYIARLESLEDLEKDRSIAYNNNNNEASSSAPKINPHEVVHPSSTPLPVTNVGNYAYGMPPESCIGQALSFQPLPERTLMPPRVGGVNR
jgi:hypothetical protein